MDLPERFDRLVREDRLWTSPENLDFYHRYLFEGVPLLGRSFLEVGAGAGLTSLWAACQGATRVVALEPEAAGSTAGVRDRFRRAAEKLALSQVEMLPETFQSYELPAEPFDVVLLHNSVNHLDEAACIRLREDLAARRTYEGLFEKLARATARGGRLVLSDCSCDNFFARLGVKNPFAPTIEWNKHQSPETWADLLREAGFAHPVVSWTSYNRLGRPGRLLLGNRLASYFLQSHFRMRMERV